MSKKKKEKKQDYIDIQRESQISKLLHAHYEFVNLMKIKMEETEKEFRQSVRKK